MTVNTELAYAERAWTGAETNFEPGFPAMEVGDLRLSYRAIDGNIEPLALGVHYEATLSEGSRLASVRPLVMPAPPGMVLFGRRTSALQPVDFQDNSRYSQDIHEELADRAAMRAAELRQDIANAVVGAIPESSLSNTVLARMAPLTLKGNNQAIPGGPFDLTIEQIVAMLGPDPGARDLLGLAEVVISHLAGIRRALPGIEPPLSLRDRNNQLLAFFDVLGRLNVAECAFPTLKQRFHPDYAFWVPFGNGVGFGIKWGDATVHAPGLPNKDLAGFVKTIGSAAEVHLIEGLYDTFTRPAARRLTHGEITGDTHAGVCIYGREVHWVRLPPGGLAPTRQYAVLDPKTTIAAGVTKLRIVIIIGQSRSNGTGSGSVLTTTPVSPGRALMFNRGFRALANSHSSASLNLDIQSDTMSGLVDAVETQNTDRETGIAQMLKVLADGSPSTDAWAAFTVGIDGTSLANQAEGTTPDRNMLRGVSALKWICDRLGIGIEVAAVWPIALEAECSANMAAATLTTQIQSRYTQCNTNLKAITGQVADIPMLWEQPSSWTYNGTGIGITRCLSPQGLLDAAAANPKIFVSGPAYQRSYADGVHCTDVSNRAQGREAGLKLAAIIAGSGYAHLRMASASRSGSVVTVTFAGLTGSLESGTGLVADPGNLGFRFRNASDVEVAITSATITGANTVELQLASNPGGPDNRVELALTGSLANAGPTTGPRTPLRDNAPLEVDPWGATSYRWACHGSVSCA